MRVEIFCLILGAIGLTHCAIRVETQKNETKERKTSTYMEFEKLDKFLTSYIDNVSNQECRRSLEISSAALLNASLWAVQMLDASAKIPLGLIVANTYQLGHYDECIAIKTDQIRGKYCIANVNFIPTMEKYPQFYNSYVENEFSLHYDPHKPVWEKFKKTKDPSKKRRDEFHMGVCIPSNCTNYDLEELLSSLIRDFGDRFGFHMNVTVPENTCSVAEGKPWTTGSWIVVYILFTFVALVTICTSRDLISSKKDESNICFLDPETSNVEEERESYAIGRFGELLESFSFRKNVEKLSQPNFSQETDVFNGMKFFSVALNILGHRCVHSYGAPFFNPEFLEERYRKIQDMFLLNGSLIVDTFFVIGGYLTCLSLLREFQAGKRISTLQVYIFRWLKITPMYTFVVFFYGYILEHMGSGPVWNMKVGREAMRCRKNWWTNLLYINNYVGNKDMCMFQSWYLSCDMHYTLLAPFIVAILARKPRRGILYLIFVIAAAAIVPFAITLAYKHDGVLRVYMQIFQDLPQNASFAEMYIKSHNRAAPYFIGMMAAYIYTRLQANKVIFPKWLVWVCSLISTFLSVCAIWGAWYFYIPGREYNAMENATYAAIHRLAWGVAMAWIPVAGGQRAFGVIQPILSKQVMAPLSRLSLGAFLVHAAIQLYFTSSMRVPEYISFPKLFWMASGDLVFSFFFAFLLHVLIEAPVQGIIKFFLTPKKATLKAKNKKE